MSDDVKTTQVDPEKIKSAIKGIVDHIVDLALEFVMPNEPDKEEKDNEDKNPKKDN